MGKRKRKRRSTEDGIPLTIQALVEGTDASALRLVDFVAKYTPSMPEISLPEDDLDAQYIKKSWIVVESLEPLTTLCTPKISESLSDILNHVIWCLVQRKSKDWSLRNVLDQGYATSSETENNCPNMRPGVVCTQINDAVNFIKTSSYARRLHQLVGDELMRVLLLKTSLFVPLDLNKEVYFMICGPVYKNINKRQQIRASSGQRLPKFQPNNFLPRHSLFYSNTYVPKVGLPSKHVLNQSDAIQVLQSMVQIRGKGNKKRRKRWARLRDRAMTICRNVLQKHKMCDYHRLLNRHCPLPDFVLDSNQEVKLPQAGAAHSSPSAVSAYCHSVVCRVFGLAFFGSPRNLDKVKGKITVFVHLRKGEGFPNKLLVEGLKVTEIDWLWGSDKEKKTKSDHEAATALLQSTMRWLFCKYLTPLLRSVFYITESEFSARRLLYYRKPVWSIFRNLAVQNLVRSHYRNITAEQASGSTVSRLKLLPKTSGVRPVAMLSYVDSVEDIHRNPSKERNFQSSTNAKLSSLYEVLRHEHQEHPEAFGSGLLGLQHAYPVLKSFLQGIRPITKELHFVSVDIEKCYDTMNQEHLLDIIDRQVLQDKQYLIHRHSIMHPYTSLGRAIRKPVRVVESLEDFTNFHELATNLSSTYSDAIFTPGMGYIVAKKQDMFALLQQHLRRNVVAIQGRFGKRFLLQCSGIPQGSVLSSFLCNYYYGDIEKNMLNEVIDEHTVDYCMIRIIDDFILITTNRDRADRFLQLMRKGKPELGCLINDKKSLSTLLNKDQDALVMLGGKTFFPWCGLLLNTCTGEVRVDYSRFARGKAIDSLVVDRCHVGRHLEMRIKTYLRPRCLPILFDCKINSYETIIINFTQMMLLAATKAREFIGQVISPTSNVEFLRHLIDQAILFSRNAIMRRLKKEGNPSSPRFSINESDALAIGRYAFEAKFISLSVDIVTTDLAQRKSSRLLKIVHDAAIQFDASFHLNKKPQSIAANIPITND
jgi:hypothetical protein